MELLATNWTNETATASNYFNYAATDSTNCIQPWVPCTPCDPAPWILPIYIPQITTITIPSFSDHQVVGLLKSLASGKPVRSWITAVANLLITLKMAEVCEWTDDSPTQRRAVAIKITALGKSVAKAL